MKKVTYETLKDALEDHSTYYIIDELLDYNTQNRVFYPEEINSLVGSLLDSWTQHTFYLGKEESKNALADKQKILNLIKQYINKYGGVI